MEKNLIYAELLDIYKGLLTEKQAEAMDYYYNSDYSLGEISELMDISRQGVRDFIKRGEKQLYEFEEKLEMVKKYNDINTNLLKLERLVDGMKSDTFLKNKEKALDVIREIKKEL